ncbi:RluA family pseudouridine synthase [Haloflavibacter putidus]|uniref:RluA family pseudouridine synthase n=1 Tax=Haloflavibacter putidus TaxID=2576776 RepID=A0A507ZS19_9FLAO|nr:RluA family pseudouridine synthase [Haloflavibacter putidus]TQD40420.1 RluA family pseudouridine synthase [Haloflavibacter putidus]
MFSIEKHIVPADVEKIRLQEYASKVFDSLPTRSSVKKAIKKERILLNGKAANTGDWIQEGQILELLAEEIKQKKIFKLRLPVVFEDDFLAVIHKPAGYPTNGNYFKTIENALAYNLKTSTQKDALPYPTAVHRLDNPTSGLLLIAKTQNAKTHLSLAFENRTVEKSYLAIVSGEIPKKGSFDNTIENKNAFTEFTRLKNFRKAEKEYALVELFPESGRTHQLRIHLSTNNFPIVGDKEYGSTETVKGILLTAHSLKFKHFITKEKLNFTAEIPKAFQKFMEEK